MNLKSKKLITFDPKYELCGTRLLCHGFFQNSLDVEIPIGSNTGKRTSLPIIKLKTTKGVWLLFAITINPINLSFAITINKSQVQTISKVEIYLSRHVFSHG